MSGAEIESIISRCAQTNVRLLELPGLRLEFGQPAQAHPAPAPETPVVAPPSGATLPGSHESEDADLLEVEKARLAEDRIAFALIENPLEMEQMIADGLLDELTEGDSDGET